MWDRGTHLMLNLLRVIGERPCDGIIGHGIRSIRYGRAWHWRHASYKPGISSGMPGITAEPTSAGQPRDFGHSHLTRAFVIAELGTNAFSDSQDAPRPTISEEEVIVGLAEMGALPDNSQTSTFAERSKRRLWQAMGWPKQTISSGIAGNVPSGAEFVGSVRTVSVFACPDGNSPFSGLLQRPFLPPNRRDDHRQVMAVDSTGKNLNLERNWGRRL